LGVINRLFWVWLSSAWSGWTRTLLIVRPETVVRWHREGFRLFWRRRSRSSRGGRPAISKDVRALIKKMASANPLWGAPRIHGELLKLGIQISQRTVGSLLPRSQRPRSQSWRTFLDNHVRDLASMDFFVVPTATFRVLFVLIVLAHDRRRIVHFAVTDSPTAAWTAQHVAEAFPWNETPRYLIRDRDTTMARYFVNGSREWESMR
jgi:hypothetical protein